MSIIETNRGPLGGISIRDLTIGAKGKDDDKFFIFPIEVFLLVVRSIHRLIA
ncbi:hypothetical protein [Aedoeadaptatus acetigenes]|uniref:hypothetical protein n=1 Tax=Aedoeadaptatus acetigenes TaxID=2981723 RepID=UPI002265C601|nr:hypothetical protein [Aedoeadaptatus acetigenes]